MKLYMMYADDYEGNECRGLTVAETPQEAQEHATGWALDNDLDPDSATYQLAEELVGYRIIVGEKVSE